eukprot:gnl/Chilomastix_caulleri/4723.p1 GENE.gnl/Chilomastix_caulleri/4723~~gnl/Chilomastix_caulleri/4723.p1  ORF type:complete len:132 (+),score=20.85 gnl/Chilomastix_caulleri/4723:187-582(+)
MQGAERFRTPVSSYCENAKAVFFVFDLSNHESFEDVKACLDETLTHCGDENIIKMLIGNKCDLEPKVTEEEIEEFIQLTHMEYVKTSAKTGEGVNEMFERNGSRDVRQPREYIMWKWWKMNMMMKIETKWR